MQFPSASLLLAAFSAILIPAVSAAPAAAPSPPSGFNEIIGPAPYEQLKAMVAARSEGGVQERDVVGKRALGGLYMCENPGFGGGCYYGIYEANKQIFPDPYWATRISAVGPDQGTYCLFYNNANCGSRSQYGEYVQQYSYPGGDLSSPVNDNVQCFICRAG